MKEMRCSNIKLHIVFTLNAGVIVAISQCTSHCLRANLRDMCSFQPLFQWFSDIFVFFYFRLFPLLLPCTLNNIYFFFHLTLISLLQYELLFFLFVVIMNDCERAYIFCVFKFCRNQFLIICVFVHLCLMWQRREKKNLCMKLHVADMLRVLTHTHLCKYCIQWVTH